MYYRTIFCLALALSACSKDDQDSDDDNDDPTDEDIVVPLYTADLVGRTLEINGSDADSRLALRLQLGAPIILELDIGDDNVAEERFELAQFDTIVINANGGADVVRIDDANGPVTLSKPTAINGGGGNDTLIGGSGAETMSGGDGDDSVIGGLGVDTVNLGAGNDSFFWSAGHGSDVLDGGEGDETLSFTGNDEGETVAISATGDHLTVAWNDASTDVANFERVAVEPLGGSDSVTVGDLSTTAVGGVSVDLRAAAGSTADGQADTVALNGTGGQDTITVRPDAGRMIVEGPFSEVTVTGYEVSDGILISATGNDLVTASGTESGEIITVAANGALVRVETLAYSANVDISGFVATDLLTVNGLGGADIIGASGNLLALVRLQLDGGEGNDGLAGSNGPDNLIGGPGDDVIDGNQGNDSIFMGEGNDTAQWDPGDGSDIVEGQAGTDTLNFACSAGAEIIALSNNGGRSLFTRNVGNIVMDLDDVEEITVHLLGGSDNVTVNSLIGTDVAQVTLDLAVAGAGDAAVDNVTVNGTANADTFDVSTIGGAVLVAGVGPLVLITTPEATDGLTMNGAAGTDTFNVDADVGPLIAVTSNQ